MFSTASTVSGKTGRSRGWWLRNGWIGRPLNLLIGLLAVTSVALSLLGSIMLLRSKDVPTDHAQPDLVTEANRAKAKNVLQRAMRTIFSGQTEQEPPPAAAIMPPNVIDRSRPSSPAMGVDAGKNVDQHKQRDSVKKPEPESDIRSRSPEIIRQERIMVEFLRYLSNQIGDLQVDLHNTSSRIAVTEESIRQLREKSWYDWCGAITTLLGQLAGLLAAALAVLKWLRRKPAMPPSVA